MSDIHERAAGKVKPQTGIRPVTGCSECHGDGFVWEAYPFAPLYAPRRVSCPSCSQDREVSDGR
jgi:hypothetical protein